MVLVVSRSVAQFCFDHLYFACPIERASKKVTPESHPWKKFVHPCIYCEVVNLLNVFYHKVFFSFLLLLMKKNYFDEKPFHLFWTPWPFWIAFWMCWISIILNKWYTLFINVFLQYFGGRGSRAEGNGREPRIEEHKHPLLCNCIEITLWH